MKKLFLVVVALLIGFLVFAQENDKKQKIKALYIPLADHYPGIVAYEKYAKNMKHADYEIKRMKSWRILRAYFMNGEADIAFIICPEAMDMFLEKPNFRWVSLMHRDGNALAINHLLEKTAGIEKDITKRRPDSKVADAIKAENKDSKTTTVAGVPHPRATHTVILYKYLKDHGLKFCKEHGKHENDEENVDIIEVPPPKSPAFLKRKNARSTPAIMDQSLPWVDIIETRGLGTIAWYSKDVMPWKHGHVECIMIASDDAIKNKKEALKEVIQSIHKAGLEIEKARKNPEKELPVIIKMIRKHIPEHTPEAITHALDLKTNGINYVNLNVDDNSKESLKQIMDLAVEAEILNDKINIEKFADESFATEITIQKEK